MSVSPKLNVPVLESNVAAEHMSLAPAGLFETEHAMLTRGSQTVGVISNPIPSRETDPLY